jgi:hypothetical protein
LFRISTFNDRKIAAWFECHSAGSFGKAKIDKFIKFNCPRILFCSLETKIRQLNFFNCIDKGSLFRHHYQSPKEKEMTKRLNDVPKSEIAEKIRQQVFAHSVWREKNFKARWWNERRKIYAMLMRLETSYVATYIRIATTVGVSLGELIDGEKWDYDQEGLADRIENLAKKLGMSIPNFCVHCGLRKSYLGKLLALLRKGLIKCGPCFQQVELIAKKSGVSIRQVLSNK